MSKMIHHPVRHQPRERGAATLIVTMVLLFSTSIIMLYLNRNILFEQRTSANQARSTTALEMAEAGVEWATGMLNTAFDIDGSCILQTSSITPFRKLYAQTMWNGTPASTDVMPATTTYPGCKVNGSTLTCSCPTPPASGSATAALGADVQPGFTIAFSSTSDPEAIRVTATGCTAQAAACTPANAANADATATVSVVLKLRPLLRAAPASPLTCGTTCDIGGSYNIINRDAGTNGILVNSGQTSTDIGGTAVTIPGQPIQNSIVANDSSLADLAASDPTCSNSAMFKAYFGSTVEQFAASPMVKSIPNCGTASTCGGLVDAAYNAGWRSFYFPDGFARNNSSGSLGTVNDPVTMVSGGGFDVNGNIDIYGVVFSNSANVNDVGTGTATLHGALVTCGGYNSNGNGTLEYDTGVMEAVRRQTGAFVRVPGSWTDRCRASTANPPVITCS